MTPDENKKDEYYLSISRYKKKYRETKIPLYISSKFKDRNAEFRNLFLSICLYVAGVLYISESELSKEISYLIGFLLALFAIQSILFLSPKKNESINALKSITLSINESYFYAFFIMAQFYTPKSIVMLGLIFAFFDIVSISKENKSVRNFVLSLLKNINAQIKQTIFFRNEFFKNTPKWDLVSFELLFPAMNFLIFYCVIFEVKMKDSVSTNSFQSLQTAFIGAMGVYVTAFWHINNSRSSKYKNAYDQYNKIIETRSAENMSKERISRIDIWATSLCIDLIQFDLWAHPSFQEIFAHHTYEVFYFFKKKKVLNHHVEIGENKTFLELQKIADTYLITDQDSEEIFFIKDVVFKGDDIVKMYEFYYHVCSRFYFKSINIQANEDSNRKTIESELIADINLLKEKWSNFERDKTIKEDELQKKEEMINLLSIDIGLLKKKLDEFERNSFTKENELKDKKQEMNNLVVDFQCQILSFTTLIELFDQDDNKQDFNSVRILLLDVFLEIQKDDFDKGESILNTIKERIENIPNEKMNQDYFRMRNSFYEIRKSFDYMSSDKKKVVNN